MQDLTTFRFWCQKVLPLVYDDSLSYYELLCKVVNYINSLIENDRDIIAEVDELSKELAEVQYFIDHFNTSFIEKELEKYLASMIYVDIENGYICYHIPGGWKNIDFHTTGLDIDVPGADFGCLTLQY